MSNELYITAMRNQGLADAADLQQRSATMDGTALYAEEEKIPDFTAAKAVKNMLERKAGQSDGFVCKSSAGRVCRLIQNYNSDTYPQEPDSAELAAQWRIVYSTDPKKAKPFLQEGAVLATCGAPPLTVPTCGHRRRHRNTGKTSAPSRR